MKSSEIKNKQSQLNLKGSDFWLSEIALQLAQIAESRAAAVEEKKPRPYTYYALEYSISDPPKLDWVGRDKPKDGLYHHKITAYNVKDATRRLIARLIEERRDESDLSPQSDQVA